MSNVRVTYSGLISLLMSSLRIVTGFGFTFILARLLLPDELGTWKLILGLISSMIFMNAMSSFWSTRDIARGVDSARTAMSLTGAFSMVSVIIFIVAIFLTVDETNASDEIIYGIILIPFLFFYHLLFAITYGYKPHLINVGQVLYGVIIVIVSVILVYFLEMGLLGIIIAAALAYLSAICLFINATRGVIKNKINFKYFKKWFKNSWVTLYHKLNEFINTFDALIFALISGNVVGLAFMTVASGIGALVGTASSMSVATYSKLLSSDNFGYLQDNMTRVIYFAFPMLAIVILYAKEGLFVFNPIYIDVYPAVALFGLKTFFHMFGKIFSDWIEASEKVDISYDSSVKDYLKSQLFHIPTVRTIRNGSYIISLTVMLVLFATNSSDVDLIIFWALIMTCVEAPFTVYFYLKAKRKYNIGVEWVKICKYGLTSIVSIGFSYYLASIYLVHENSLFIFLPNLFLFVITGCIMYFGITYTIDTKTRELTKSIIKELRKKI